MVDRGRPGERADRSWLRARRVPLVGCRATPQPPQWATVLCGVDLQPLARTPSQSPKPALQASLFEAGPCAARRRGRGWRRAGVAAAAAVGGVGVEVDLAAVGAVAVAVGEARVAGGRSRRRRWCARRGRVGCAARARTRRSYDARRHRRLAAVRRSRRSRRSPRWRRPAAGAGRDEAGGRWERARHAPQPPQWAVVSGVGHRSRWPALALQSAEARRAGEPAGARPRSAGGRVSRVGAGVGAAGRSCDWVGVGRPAARRSWLPTRPDRQAPASSHPELAQTLPQVAAVGPGGSVHLAAVGRLASQSAKLALRSANPPPQAPHDARAGRRVGQPQALPQRPQLGGRSGSTSQPSPALALQSPRPAFAGDATRCGSAGRGVPLGGRGTRCRRRRSGTLRGSVRPRSRWRGCGRSRRSRRCRRRRRRRPPAGRRRWGATRAPAAAVATVLVVLTSQPLAAAPSQSAKPGCTSDRARVPRRRRRGVGEAHALLRTRRSWRRRCCGRLAAVGAFMSPVAAASGAGDAAPRRPLLAAAARLLQAAPQPPQWAVLPVFDLAAVGGLRSQSAKPALQTRRFARRRRAEAPPLVARRAQVRPARRSSTGVAAVTSQPLAGAVVAVGEARVAREAPVHAAGRVAARDGVGHRASVAAGARSARGRGEEAGLAAVGRRCRRSPRSPRWRR